MSLASVHYAFTSRDELIAHVIDYVVEQQARAALDTLEVGVDLRTTIRNGLRAYLSVIAADPEREQAMFELTQWALRTPEMAGSARRQYESYHRAGEYVLSAIAEATGCRWKRPIPEMARILITLTDGLTLAWLVDRDDKAAEQIMDFAAGALVAEAES